MTKTTGLPRRLRIDGTAGAAIVAAAAAATSEAADSMLDAVLAGEKLGKPGRSAALNLIRSIASPTASDMMTIVMFARMADEDFKLSRLGAKAPPNWAHKNLAAKRALLRDLGARSRDREPTIVPFYVQPTGLSKATGDNVVNWVDEAAKLGLA